MKRQRRLRTALRGMRTSLTWRYLRRQGWWLVLTFVAMLAGTAGLLPAATVFRSMVDDAIVNQAVPIEPFLPKLIVLAIIGGVTTFVMTQSVARAGYQLELDLRTDIYRSLQAADPARVEAMAGGQIVTRAIADLNMIQRILQILPLAVALVPLVFGLGIFLFVISPPMALIALAPLPVNIRLMKRIRDRMSGLSWAELNEQAEVTAAVDEPVRGIRVVKAFGREEFERRKLAETAERTYRFSMSRVRVLAGFDFVLKLLPAVSSSLLLLVGGRLVGSDSLTLGSFLIAFQVAQGLTQLAGILDIVVSYYHYLRTAQGRIAEVLALADAVVPPVGGQAAPAVAGGLVVEGVEVTLAGRAVLRRVEVRIGPGELVAVTGPPGAGKSTLAYLAAGYHMPDRGTVTLDGVPLADLDERARRRAIRVVPEEAFLFATTLRENLLQATENVVTDDDLLAALHAAGAEEVVDLLPGGLDGELGDRGLTVSGGQRQRIALARALVQPPRVLVLDDALSAVNPSLEQEVLTRIRAHAPATALLLVTRRNPPKEPFDRIVQLPAPVEDAPVAGSVEAPAPAPLAEATAWEDGLRTLVGTIELSDDRPAVRNDDVLRDEPVRVGELWRRLRWLFAIVLGLVVLRTLSDASPELMFGEVSDLVEDDRKTAADVAALTLLLIGVVGAGSAYLLQIQLKRLGHSALYLLRRRLFQRLSGLGIDYYDRELPGEISARLVYDIDQVERFVERTGISYLPQLGKIVVCFGLVLALSPAVFPIVVVLAALIAIVTAIQLPLMNRALDRARDHLGIVTSAFEEDFLGRRELRHLAGEVRQSSRFDRLSADLRRARRSAALVSNGYSALMTTLGQVTGAVVLYQSGHRVLAGLMTVGTALTLRLLAETATRTTFTQVAVGYNELLTTRVSWKRLQQPWQHEVMPRRGPETKPAPELRGDVVFDRVSFTYPHTGRQVLDRVSFRLERGAVTALVGYTGAGKSSIAKLLTATYDPDQGSVLVDGIDLRTLDPSTYRIRLGIVPQEAFLFRGTVSSNVAYGNLEATPEAIDAAVRAVGADRVLNLLPDWHDHPVEEDGRNLTMAQRQLIALARAWLAGPDILVLDEATSNLDPQLERVVVDTVARLGRTTLMVTHREDVVARADHVIVLRDGIVAEEGAPHALRGTGGAFDDLWGAPVQAGPLPV